MIRTRLGAGREIGEIVERLVMELEVRHRGGILAVQGCPPGAAIPGPADALQRQQVADGDFVLRRQRRCGRRIGIGRVTILG